MDESIQRQLEQRNEVADVLRRARALISDPDRWAQDIPYTCANERGGFSYCAEGAIFIALSGIAHESDITVSAINALGDAIGVRHIPSWNDDDSRTHADVLAAFTKAIELAEQPGA